MCILILRTYRNTQAVVTQLDTGAVSYDDAFFHKVVVDALGIGHLCQEEVGIGGIYLFADSKFLEGVNHASAFLQQDTDPFLNLFFVAQCFFSVSAG